MGDGLSPNVLTEIVTGTWGRLVYSSTRIDND